MVKLKKNKRYEILQPLDNMKHKIPKRVAWIQDGLLFVVTRGKTTNGKIASPKEVVVQTYTYDLRQYALANCGRKITMQEFFALDSKNCLDCPLSSNSGNGECYTHKPRQYSGFLSQLRSLGKNPSSISQEGLTQELRKQLFRMSNGLYVRFGAYGEPSLMPVDLVRSMVIACKTWTGYTHQAHQEWAKDYAMYFQASSHSDQEADMLRDYGGWRSFIVTDKNTTSNAVQCPASAEAGYKSICSKCGLCSGISGKGSKNIKIQNHF